MSGAKTEEPTTARLKRARDEGDSGASLQASQALAFVVAAALLPATVAAVVGRFESHLRGAIGRASAPDVTASMALEGLSGVAGDVAALSAPVLGGVALAIAAASVLQNGGFAARRKVRGSSPLARLGAPFSRARLFAVVRALAGGALVAWIVSRELQEHLVDLARSSGQLSFVAPVASTILRSVGWKVALGGLALAAIDLLVTRMLWRGRLRMSRDEVRRERREAEGDPLIKRAREAAREEALTRGTLGDLPRARLVVWDGKTVACALRYEAGDRAPVVVVTGEGEAAEGLVRRARALGVAVVEDPGVAPPLAALAEGETIPEALYDPVAELLGSLPP